jgi:hypothetical protein
VHSPDSGHSPGSGSSEYGINCSVLKETANSLSDKIPKKKLAFSVMCVLSVSVFIPEVVELHIRLFSKIYVK